MKSNRSRLAVALLVFAVFACPALADVAPPPGYLAVENALELRTTTQISGFRFFLTDAAGEIEEIIFSPGTAKVFEAAGRGGAARFASVWAVPSESLEGRELNDEALVKLVSELEKGTIEGQVRLLGHEFRKEVSVIQSGTEQREVYEVSLSADSGRPEAKPIGASAGTAAGGSIALIATAVGGGLIFLAVLIGGILLIRRLSRRAVE